jgi:hypothetical protein
VTAGKQNVAGLDVPVDDAPIVSIVQPVRHLARNPECLIERKLALPIETLTEGLSLDERHHVVEKAVGLTRVVKWKNVGVGKTG